MIAITDEADGLTVHHYTDCDIQSPKEVREMRGIIREGDLVVCKSFSFTPELRTDDPQLSSVLNEFLNEHPKAYQGLEGTLLRIWYREKPNGEGEWYISTHRKLDAFLSRWSSDYTYGEHFIQTLLVGKEMYPELRSIDTFQQYTEQLNKDKIYILLLRSSKSNRVVCTSQTQTQLYTVGAFLRSKQFEYQEGSTCPEAIFRPIPEIDRSFSSTNDVVQYIEALDPFDTQGILFITSSGQTLKILNNKYDDIAKLRGNIPNVLLRYIQLRNTSSSQIHEFQALYSDYVDDFMNFERVMLEITKNIHRKYMIRFIHHKIAMVPPEQFYIIKDLHQQYIATKNIINFDMVSGYLKSLSPGKLMSLYQKFLQREKDLGNGNYITAEERNAIPVKSQ